MDQGPKNRSTTIKLLEENIVQKLYNIGFGNHFLNVTSKAQVIKFKKIDKLDFLHEKF